MDSILDSTWGLGNADLLQNIGMLVWANTGNPDLFQKVTSARVTYEMFNRMSGERDLEAQRTNTILAISEYVKKNPKASKEELTKEVAKQIWLFKERIEKL
jgi:hypothetical protein